MFTILKNKKFFFFTQFGVSLVIVITSMGNKAAMACTVAVEDETGEHYKEHT